MPSFFHPVAQGIRMQSQDQGCAARALDNPVGLLQDGDDVVALHRLQGEIVLGWRRV
jgi:hypothetical protein